MATDISQNSVYGLSPEGLVSFVPEYPQLLARPAAAEALLKLQKKAAEDGFELAVCSAWRGFSRQFEIFDGKMAGSRPVLDENEQPFDISALSPLEKVAAIARFSAIPGFSRHHFGTDFDIFAKNLLPEGQKLQLTAAEYAKGAYFYEFGLWLEQNLSAFGFDRPFTGRGSIGYEPWHISFTDEASLFLKAFDPDKACAILLDTKAPWAEAACAYVRTHGAQSLALS